MKSAPILHIRIAGVPQLYHHHRVLTTTIVVSRLVSLGHFRSECSGSRIKSYTQCRYLVQCQQGYTITDQYNNVCVHLCP